MFKEHVFIRKLTGLYTVLIIIWIVISDLLYLMLKEILKGHLFFIAIIEFLFLVCTVFLFYWLSNKYFLRNIRIFERYIHLLKEHASTIEKNNRLETVTENIDTGIFIIDANEFDFPITFINRGFQKLTQYEQDELSGKNFCALTGKITDNKVIEELREGLKERTTKEVEILLYKKDGTVFWANIKLHPVFDEYGDLVHFLGFLSDITQRKYAEFLLEENEQRYKSLFENNPDIVLSIDLKGYITSANPEAFRVTGFSECEIIGRSYLRYIENNKKKVLNFLTSAHNGMHYRTSLKVKHKNGTLIDLQVHSVPIKIEGEVVGIYVIARDLTEYNKTQELLRRSDNLNVVGELAAGVAHEIRNPLTSLKGFTQLIGSRINDENKQYLEVMSQELDRINQIVGELLLLAKPQMADFKLESLKSILTHVQTLLNTQAIMNNIHIELEYKADNTHILCVEHQMKQVFINIIKNAIEAMPNGGKIRILVEASQDEQLLIKIVDQGMGIPPDRLKKLGEPFYTTKERGTGLGLMISFKIIEEHSGLVHVTSTLGVGTTFDIILPVAKGELEKQEQEQAILGQK